MPVFVSRGTCFDLGIQSQPCPMHVFDQDMVSCAICLSGVLAAEHNACQKDPAIGTWYGNAAALLEDRRTEAVFCAGDFGNADNWGAVLASVHQARHDPKELDPPQSDMGRSCFLLNSVCNSSG